MSSDLNQSQIITPGQPPVPVIVTPQPWITNTMQTAIAGALFTVAMAALTLAATWLHAWQLELAGQYQLGHQEVVKAVADAKTTSPIVVPPTQDPTMAEVLRQIRQQNDKTAESIKALELKLDKK